jgi:fumarate reductase subunit D
MLYHYKNSLWAQHELLIFTQRYLSPIYILIIRIAKTLGLVSRSSTTHFFKLSTNNLITKMKVFALILLPLIRHAYPTHIFQPS